MAKKRKIPINGQDAAAATVVTAVVVFTPVGWVSGALLLTGYFGKSIFDKMNGK